MAALGRGGDASRLLRISARKGDFAWIHGNDLCLLVDQVSASSMCRVVLRAEIENGADRIVTNTTALSESSVTLATELASHVGAEVKFQLSFPGLLEPRLYSGRVLEVHSSDGYGFSRAIRVAFLFRDDEERRSVGEIVERVRESGVFRAAARSGRGAYRVLLVEDNELIREMFAYGVDKYFRKNAATVTVDFADDAEAAWEKLRSTSYDLAIVDYFLPSSTGAQLVARMRRDEALHGLPVVAISVGGSQAREASLEAGADLFLDKPIVLRDLFTTLARLTAQEAP
jgi:CheY-like chemotaxis protein